MIRTPSLKPSRTAVSRVGGLLSNASKGEEWVGKGKAAGGEQRVTIGIYQVETRKPSRISPMAVIILIKGQIT
jgi:hypothetical protein